MSEVATTIRDLESKRPQPPSRFAATISRNIAASLARVFAVSLVALVLPAYLAQHLPVSTYAAWVLILQLAAYVSYLDLGIQTAVSKFVAEYDAKGNRAGAGHYASAGLVLMMLAALLGVGLSFVLAWEVPRLFRSMPEVLYHDVRVSLVLVGSSLSFGLICAIYSAVFQGLQRYGIPMTIAIVNRASFVAVVVAVVAFHGNLTEMGAAVAMVNIATGVLQITAWRRRASHIRLSMGWVEYSVLKKVARFCFVQSIWIAGMLCVTGLDVVIVGHYDYAQTAYYSIATLPTSFMLLIVASVLNPLVPASSALITLRSATEMGELLAKATRYSTMILLLTGLPLIVFGLPLLRLWVGPEYAAHTLSYLQILVLANIIRNLCAPYATMIVASGKQGPATVAAVGEAAVNLGASIYLASRLGAVGVALGTLLGSLVSVSLHFAVSMHYSSTTLAISRSRLAVKGLLQPLSIAIPSLILLLLWPLSGMTLTPGWSVVWIAVTLAFAWLAALGRDERSKFIRLVRNRFAVRSESDNLCVSLPNSVK